MLFLNKQKSSNINFIVLFSNCIKHLKSDTLSLITFLALFAKSLLFILLISSPSATKIITTNVPGFSIIIILGFTAVIVSFSYLFKNRVHLWFLFLINLFISVIMIGDLWYYRSNQSFLSPHLLSITGNLDNLSDSVFSMIRLVDFVFASDLLLIMIFMKKLRKKYMSFNRNIFLFILVFLLSTGAIWLKHYKADILENGSKEIVFRICWTPNQTMGNLSPIGYHIYETYKYVIDSKEVALSPEEKNKIASWFDRKKEDLPDNKYYGLFKGKNLIFLQVESLEKFVLNKSVNGQEITPNLNKLLNNSIFFTNFYEQVNNGTSSDSDLMSNTSVYPVRSGSTFFRYPNNSYNSLPKLLQKSGYSTLAIHPDKGAYWNWMPALYSIGFQKCVDASNFKMDEVIGLGLSDGSYLKQVAPIIAKQPKPFYTFMVTLTSHGPFNLPKEYRELTLDKSLDETKLGGYFQSIHYTDKHIGLFIDSLAKENLLDDTVIVIFGDHCGIHKYYADELPGIKPSQDWWMENNTQIPFIVYNKNMNPEKINVSGGQIDTLPTAAYLMGINKKEYENTAMGRNLLNTKKDFAVLSTRNFIGKYNNEQEKKDAIDGIDIADLIIRSNYFKNK